MPILRLARGPAHKASDEVLILRLARGPARKASDEVPILRLARGLACKASDEVPILHLARGPACKASDEVPILRLARGRLGDNPVASASTDFPDRTSRPTNATNHSRDVSRTTAQHSGATDEMGVASTPCRPGRDGAGVTGRCVGTVPTTDARAALCGLTPTAPRTVRRGESSLGPCSLGISVQDQLLPPCLGNLL